MDAGAGVYTPIHNRISKTMGPPTHSEHYNIETQGKRTGWIRTLQQSVSRCTTSVGGVCVCCACVLFVCFSRSLCLLVGARPLCV